MTMRNFREALEGRGTSDEGSFFEATLVVRRLTASSRQSSRHRAVAGVHTSGGSIPSKNCGEQHQQPNTQ